eukprot:GGOE01019075.1.p1 GENE.GGOE01019075.1~~GGOE01019075.1.p1  ORF type:complete len:528 (+),score=107.31 GGOE01019075.1:80-1585(+)
MGAACCSDKYLLPQRYPSRKGVSEYEDSVRAEAGEDAATAHFQKYEADAYILQAWGERVTQGLVAVPLAKSELVHTRPHPSDDILQKRQATDQLIVENIDPLVVGTMALSDFRRPVQSKEQLLQLTELKQALASDSDSRTISQVLKYNSIHSWIVNVPFRVDPIMLLDVDWEEALSDDERDGLNEEEHGHRTSGSFEGPFLSAEVLEEHNTRIMKVERSKLSSLVSQSKTNLFVEKSARIATLMEAMAAAIDPSLSSLCNARRDDCIFSSILSSENQSQPGMRDSEGRRNTRRQLNSRSSSQSSKESEAKAGISRASSFTSPGKTEQQGFVKQRLRRYRTFDLEREDPDQCVFLVCDDNDVNCQIVTCLLSKLCNCKCVITHDGFQAVETFSSHPPNHFRAVFMDIHMPECDGVQATRMIRQREQEWVAASTQADGGASKGFRRTPIIGITADSDSKVQAQCLEAGTNRVLLKPTKKEDVRDALVQFGVLQRQPPQLPEGM